MAVVSQSGAILSCLLGAFETSNTGVSKAIGYGNAIDIDEADIYEYLAKDRNTGVVISYIESLGDGRKFIEKQKSYQGKITAHPQGRQGVRGRRQHFRIQEGLPGNTRSFIQYSGSSE